MEANQRHDWSSEVVTDRGTIQTEHLVNAAGSCTREVGTVVDIYLQLQPMEHQYIVTDEISEIVERESEHPHVMDSTSESYLRR